MLENPYQAPSEQDSEGPVAAIEQRSWLSVLFFLGCLGLAAFFLSVAALCVIVFIHRPDRRVIPAILWMLLNAAIWCVTGWATWTGRRRLRRMMLFVDLAALLSAVAIG